MHPNVRHPSTVSPTRAVLIGMLMCGNSIARMPLLLHHNSAPGLDALLDQGRGADAPHPSYPPAPADPQDMIASLTRLTAR